MELDYQRTSSRTRARLLRVPLALSLAAVALALGLSGCGSGTTSTTASNTRQSAASSVADPLASYIEASRPMVEAEVERYSDLYSDFAMEAEGVGTLVYRYTYRNQVDTGQVQSDFATLESTLKATANDVIIPEMRRWGVEDPAVKWVYYNSDGAVVAVVESN